MNMCNILMLTAPYTGNLAMAHIHVIDLMENLALIRR